MAGRLHRSRLGVSIFDLTRENIKAVTGAIGMSPRQAADRHMCHLWASRTAQHLSARTGEPIAEQQINPSLVGTRSYRRG